MVTHNILHPMDWCKEVCPKLASFNKVYSIRGGKGLVQNIKLIGSDADIRYCVEQEAAFLAENGLMLNEVVCEDKNDTTSPQTYYFENDDNLTRIPGSLYFFKECAAKDRNEFDVTGIYVEPKYDFTNLIEALGFDNLTNEMLQDSEIGNQIIAILDSISMEQFVNNTLIRHYEIHMDESCHLDTDFSWINELDSQINESKHNDSRNHDTKDETKRNDTSINETKDAAKHDDTSTRETIDAAKHDDTSTRETKDESKRNDTSINETIDAEKHDDTSNHDTKDETKHNDTSTRETIDAAKHDDTSNHETKDETKRNDTSINETKDESKETVSSEDSEVFHGIRIDSGINQNIKGLQQRFMKPSKSNGKPKNETKIKLTKDEAIVTSVTKEGTDEIDETIDNNIVSNSEPTAKIESENIIEEKPIETKRISKTRLTKEEDETNRQLLKDLRKKFKEVMTYIDNTCKLQWSLMRNQMNDELESNQFKTQWSLVYLEKSDDVSTELYAKLYYLDKAIEEYHKYVVKQVLTLGCVFCAKEWEEDITFLNPGIHYVECPHCYAERGFEKYQPT